jgi:cytochrome c-type biogenesis protein
MEDLSPLVAFTAGLLSLLSPCILPMLPVYLGSLCGPGLFSEGASRRRPAVFLHSLSFVLGFSLVFIALGTGAGLVGQAVSSHLVLVRRISGSLMILFGLFMLATNWVPRLNFEKRIAASGEAAGGYLRSFSLGLLFALAWTPCVGPVLGGILALAFSSESAWSGGWLLAFYSLGLALPFLAFGLLFDSLLPRLRRFKRFSAYVYLAGGLLLIAMGVLILLNKVSWFAY